MIYLLCFISTVIYLSSCSPINVQVDGLINFEQNWKFYYTTAIIRRDSGEKTRITSTKITATDAVTISKVPKVTEQVLRITRHYADEDRLKKINNKDRMEARPKNKKRKRKNKNKEFHEFLTSILKSVTNAVSSMTEGKSLTESTTETKKKTTYTTMTIPQLRATLFYNHPHIKYWGNDSGIYRNAVLVKDNANIQNFTYFVFNQSIGVFNTLKSKVNSTHLSSKVDYLAKSYIDKFTDFVKKTQDQKILTRLGNQKVVFNTIETSNRLIRRLLNYLIPDIWSKKVLSDDGLEIALRNEVENELQQEYVQACLKFNICRGKEQFSGFLSELFTIFLKVDNSQLKQAMDALTESLKYLDLSKIMDKKIETKFLSKIDMIERAEPFVLRPMIWMFRNIIVNKNQPLIVSENTQMNIVNQTVAILDVIDLLDQQIQPTEETLLLWTDIKASVVQWASRERADIQEIIQVFIEQLVNKQIGSMNNDMLQNVRDKLKIILV